MKENYLEKQVLEIKTIEGFNGEKASFCPERGGIITSLKLNGQEILYLDEETFNNTGVSVKGGIPILFPNAGPLTKNSEFPNLSQHGFARNSEWQTDNTENGFKETLSASESTLAMYPYDFNFSIEGKFERDGSFVINQTIENKEEGKELPIAMGLHPYFKVPGNEQSDIKKRNIRFNFKGGEEIENQVDRWAHGQFVSIDNPKLEDPEAVVEVKIPELGTLIIDISPEYKKIWVWSMSDKDFVCIEPVMRDSNGLIDDPENIKPQETYSASVKFKLKES